MGEANGLGGAGELAGVARELGGQRAGWASMEAASEHLKEGISHPKQIGR